MPESHMEVGCLGTWGLEPLTPNPGRKSTPKACPTHTPNHEAPPATLSPGPSTCHTEPRVQWRNKDNNYMY